MRRLVIESTIEEVGRYLDAESEIEKLEHFEILNLLKEEPREWAMVCRVQMKDPKTRFEKALGDDFTEIQHLETEKDGSHIYFIRHKPNPLAAGLFATGGFLSIPLEIRGGRIRASFLGSASDLKRLLKLLDDEGIHYRISSNTDASFSPDSAIGLLTEKQRKVITMAFYLGYYNIPKKVNSNELAKRLHIREATFVRHRIKAERRLLAALLSET